MTNTELIKNKMEKELRADFNSSEKTWDDLFKAFQLSGVYARGMAVMLINTGSYDYDFDEILSHRKKVYDELLKEVK